jgi:enoyl-CoA hydratase/carnithine racemase
MSDVIFLEEREGFVARLTLNRPSARNALSLAMLETVTQAVRRLGADKSVHVIVIAGNGPAFCAGHDLKELTVARAEQDGGHAFFEETMGKCAALMLSIVRCPKPVIAEVQGIASIWRWGLRMRGLPHRGSTSAFSVQRLWSLCHVMWGARLRCACC